MTWLASESTQPSLLTQKRLTVLQTFLVTASSRRGSTRAIDNSLDNTVKMFATCKYSFRQGSSLDGAVTSSLPGAPEPLYIRLTGSKSLERLLAR